MAEASFERWGPAAPESPVVLSVPHAGRAYPEEAHALLRLPPAALRVLEDRHVDAVAALALGPLSALVQRLPRAWIDLNRGEEERDPAVDAGAVPLAPGRSALRLRSGLGLVPRRAGAAGEVWRRRLTDAEVRARIEDAHRPYHAALAALLEQARRRFGVAVLLDLHSMPPLAPRANLPRPPRVVLGDRYGRAAGGRFLIAAQGAAGAASRLEGAVAVNAPYAGAHVLARHGRPERGVHALQLELDRTLYLDAALDRPGPGLPAAAALVRAVAAALEGEALGGKALGGGTALAAE